MRRPRVSRNARIAISVLLLAGLVWWIGPQELLDSLVRMEWSWLLAAIVVNYVALAIGGINVTILTRVLVPETGWWHALRAYTRSWAIGMVAPGKFGDLSYAHYLSDETVNLAPGLAVAIVDKVITFVVTSLIAVIGLGVYVGAADAAWGAAFALAAMGGLMFVMFNPKIRTLVSNRLFSRYAERFAGLSDHMRTLLLTRRDILALNIFLTVVRMLVISAVIGLELRAFGVTVRILDVVVVQAVTQLVSLVPITFAGLGLRQGASVVLFERIAGIPNAPVLNQGLIHTFLGYANVVLVFAFLGVTRVEMQGGEDGQ